MMRNEDVRDDKAGSAASGGAGPGMRKRRGSKTGAKDVTCFPRPELEQGDVRTVICCADDTDDVTGATSTGYVVQLLASKAASMGGLVELGITRHQLLLAEGVPYTSHNSSMCFSVRMDVGCLERFKLCAPQILEQNSVAGSDPGLCIACLPDKLTPQARCQIALLVEFGRAAQTRLCTKDEAYRLASRISWVGLEEHGGTGDGVIGALAGVGLRLSGNDGRFRGAWDSFDLMGLPHANSVPAGDLVRAASCKAGGPAQVVRFGTWEPLDHAERVLLSRKAKPIYKDAKLTFVAESCGDGLVLCEKVDLGHVGCGQSMTRDCPSFRLDNDLEECVSDKAATCRNCLYRRWTDNGFTCVAEGACA